MLTTPLHSLHKALGATLVPFAGWEMPLHYGSQIEEHMAVRTTAGWFDVSHMVITDLNGPQAKAYLQYLLANDVEKCPPGKALYSPLLNESGGIIDDLIVYHIEADYYRIISNAATRDKDLDWLKKQACEFAVTLKNVDNLALIAVQGPQAIERAAPFLPERLRQAATSLKPFACCLEKDFFIARTGYTGESGLEIALPEGQAQIFAQQLTDNGVRPIGLGARDSLRLEAGLNLYGSDMDEGVTPFESNIAWTVDLKNADRDFIGRQAVTHNANNHQTELLGIMMEDKGMLKAGLDVFSGGECVGTITSAAWSPVLSKSIGMARVKVGASSEAHIKRRDRACAVRLVSMPFVKKGQPVLLEKA